MPSKVNWSYLAGIIDGEGCICITKSETRQRNKGWRDKPPLFYLQYQMYVQATNTNLVLMKWLVQTFGGDYHITYPEDVVKNHKARYEWSPKGNAHKKTVLLSILPYLVLKNEQAKLGLAYIDLGYGKQTERECLLQRMKVLNKRGIPND